MSKGMAGRAAKVLIAILIGLGATFTVAGDETGARTQPAPTATKAAAEPDKSTDRGPAAWVLVLAGVGVVGWAALRRLGQR